MQTAFSLHAMSPCPRTPREQLEHLCRYLLRPPVLGQMAAARQLIDSPAPSVHDRRSVITLALHLFRLLPFLLRSHRPLALEPLALRQQLAVYKRTAPRPRLRPADRLF